MTELENDFGKFIGAKLMGHMICRRRQDNSCLDNVRECIFSDEKGGCKLPIGEKLEKPIMVKEV